MRDVAGLGARIRQERLTRTPPLTLADVAGGELSVGLLSRIERGLVTPSLATVATIARRLDVPVAALFTPGRLAGVAPARALAAARALLLLGEPAAAAPAAEAAAPRAEPLVQARLLAVAAEARLVLGTPAAAADRLAEARRALDAAERTRAPSSVSGGVHRTDREIRVVRAELGLVEGLAERRRGDRAAAERSWAAALDELAAAGADQLVHVHAMEQGLLLSRLMQELAVLHDSSGALETARNFLGRAMAALVAIADPAAQAAGALRRAGWLDGGAASAVAAGIPGEVREQEVVAEALAITAAAGRLRARAALDAARLERLPRGAAASPPPDTTHSRHLR